MTTLKTTIPLLAATAVLLAGCTKGAPMIEPARPTVDAAAIVQTLKDGEAQWVQDYKARDLTKVEGHYAPGATVMQPGLPLMTTREALHTALSDLVKDPNMATAFSADEVGVAESGELAYTRGRFTQTTTDPKTGKPTTVSGSYLTLYRRQPDGSWKAVEDIAAPTLPPVTPANPG